MVGKFALLLFPLLMAFAASSDLLTMRISNRVVLLLVAIFCAMAVGLNMPLQEFGLHVACATIVLIVAFAFFAFGWIGGGDAKLAAATTFWLGFGVTLDYLLYASLIGGMMTLVILTARSWPLPTFMSRIVWVDGCITVKRHSLWHCPGDRRSHRLFRHHGVPASRQLSGDADNATVH